MGQAAQLLGVSPDTIRRWADAGRLSSTPGPRGQRLYDGVELARFARELVGERSSAPPSAQSARNRFLGIVTDVVKDRVVAKVEIQAGPHRFVSLVTREAVDELGLVPGMVVDAVVKATSVGVEIPAHL